MINTGEEKGGKLRLWLQERRERKAMINTGEEKGGKS